MSGSESETNTLALSLTEVWEYFLFMKRFISSTKREFTVSAAFFEKIRFAKYAFFWDRFNFVVEKLID